MTTTVHTIGHSRHSIAYFVSLLKRHRIDAVADIRSVPYSRRHPQFSRRSLHDELRRNGVAYVFLGRELGGRSDDQDCYREGRVQYHLLARTPLFQSGLERIREGSRRWRIALMCAEKDPLDCHRTILVARYLAEGGSDVAHILADGRIESHDEAMKRLSLRLGVPERHLFDTHEQLRARAYDMQERRIAYAVTRREHEKRERWR